MGIPEAGLGSGSVNYRRSDFGHLKGLDFRNASLALERRMLEQRKLRTFGLHDFPIPGTPRLPAKGLWGSGIDTPIYGTREWHRWWQSELVPIARKLRIFDPTLTGATPMLTMKDIRLMAKATIDTADAGAINPVYSALISMSVSADNQAVRSSARKGWTVQGFRVKSAVEYGANLGIAEGAVLRTPPETMVFREVSPSVKEIEGVWSYSARQEVLSRISDGVSLSALRDQKLVEFLEAWDTDLLTDFDTLPVNNYESIDRITASASEQAGVGATVGDEDLYGVDRSANAWFDANSDHNSGVDRSLTIPLIDALARDTEVYWDYFPGSDPGDTWYLTGRNTFERWSSIQEAKERLTMANVTISIGDGLQYSGLPTGFKIVSHRDRPIVRDDNVAQDVLRRVYLIHNRLYWIAEGLPLVSLTAGDKPEDMFVIGHLFKDVIYQAGESYSPLPPGLSKLRDLL